MSDERLANVVTFFAKKDEREQAQQKAKLQHLTLENNRLSQIWQIDDRVREIFRAQTTSSTADGWLPQVACLSS